MNTINLKGTLRTDIGKKATSKLRADGFVPCNLYGGDKNINFHAPYNDFTKLIYTPDFFKTIIEVEGKEYEAVIREVQFHPVTDRITHIDFLELIPGRAVTVDIPVELTGLAKGVKNGGKLILKTRKIRVKATPDKMVNVIKVDVTNLALGKSIKVKEAITNELEVITSASIPVASVVVPRAMRSAAEIEEEEAAEAAAAEAGEDEGEEGAGEESKEKEESSEA
ncbi:MAG: 50S ribosomal protein L25 [Chitinophagales bacterium]